MLAEIVNINNAYRLSDEQNKNIPKLVEIDKNLLINKLLTKISQTPVKKETLGIHLFAINAIYTLDKAMNKYQPIKSGFSNKVEQPVDKIRKTMEEKFKKTLKNDFREIYDRVYDNESLYTPFDL